MAEAVTEVAETSTSPRTDFQLVHTLSGHDKTVSSVKFRPQSGELLASCSADGCIVVWNVEDGNEVSKISAHDQGISDLCWSAGGDYLCSASDDKTARIWDVETGQCVRKLDGHTHYVFCCDFHPAGNVVATGSFDETVRMWDVRSAHSLKEIPAHGDPVTAVSFCHDGTLLASSSFDGIARVWDGYTGHCLTTLINKSGPPVGHAVFTPNSEFLLMCALDSRMTLWDYTGGSVVREYEGGVNSKYCVTPAFVTKGGQWLVMGSEDHSILVWDVNSMKVAQRLEGRPEPNVGGSGHCDVVLGVASRPGRGCIASCGGEQDRSVKVWLDANCEELPAGDEEGG